MVEGINQPRSGIGNLLVDDGNDLPISARFADRLGPVRKIVAQLMMFHDAARNEPSLIALVLEMVQVGVGPMRFTRPREKSHWAAVQKAKNAVMGGVGRGEMAFPTQAFL